MNLIEQIARMIDAEGAYGEAFDGTGPNAKPIPVTTRQRFFRARYEHEAFEIARLVLSVGEEKLREDLVAFEVDGWERLGLSHSGLREMVEQKHASHPPAPSE